MSKLKYTVIKNARQYNDYCRFLHDLDFLKTKNKEIKEEIALLTLLIEKYDEQHSDFTTIDPVTFLKSLMEEHSMKAIDLANLLKISKGYVSDILNYKKGLSKEVIRKLAAYFKVSQEAFNREYELRVSENLHLRNARVMNTKKKLSASFT